MSRDLPSFFDISHLEDPNDPTSMLEVVFPSANTETYLRRWVSRSTSTRNLLFYGPPGTGKTRSAYIFSRERTKDLDDWEPIEYVECESGTADQLLQRLKNQVFTLQRVNSPKWETIVILDEIDNFKPDQQKQLKKVLERNDYTFLLLTNNLNKIDAGLRNRCHEISWHIPPFEVCRKRLQVLLSRLDRQDIDDAALEKRIYTRAGWRQMVRNIDLFSIASEAHA